LRFVAALAALASVLIAASVLALTTTGAGSDRAPVFAVECTSSHRSADDPIVHPGHAGAGHAHDFFGNTATSSSSTAESLLGGPTSCHTVSDTAAYWTPTLYDGDTAIEPGRLFAYYRRPPIAVPSKAIEPFPFGLAVVAEDVEWRCGPSGQSAAAPRSCPRSAPLTMRVTFPTCWTGTELDSPDHRGHVVYPERGRCPESHPHALPQLELDVAYLFAGEPSGLRLSSGPTSTAHADFLNAWDPAALSDRVDSCLVRGTRCGPLPIRLD
jgi:hypothetical protein